jgi:hypothetical protein
MSPGKSRKTLSKHKHDTKTTADQIGVRPYPHFLFGAGDGGKNRAALIAVARARQRKTYFIASALRR